MIISKIKEADEAKWYIDQTIKYGWSRNILWHHIDSDLYQRQAKSNKITNFTNTLPPLQSDLAQEMIKDPYKLDFLSMEKEAREKDIEKGLVKHITQFLLELGAGFAFVGQQHEIEISGKTYHIDLLFYHLKLRCYIAIELKAREFKPIDAGQINFYLSAIDDIIKHPDDNPSIGLILCKTKDKITAEYALKDMNKAIGISEYITQETIPNDFKGSLPSIEEIEAELSLDIE